MRIAFQQLERRADLVDWSDITSSVCTGAPSPTVDGEWIDIPFEPDVTDPEQQRRIVIRLITRDDEEEQNYLAAFSARANNNDWAAVTTAAPHSVSQQIINAARAIQGDTSFTAAERDNYIRQLAQAAEQLTLQARAASVQRNAIILMLLRLMNTSGSL